MSETTQPGPLVDSDLFVLKEALIQIAVQFLLHGIYSALVMIVLYKLWTNKVTLAACRILSAAAISIFVASTAQISIDLAYYLILLSTVGFNPPNVERPLIYMSILGNAMIRLNYLIGDSIVVWRAWVIWTHHPRVHILLIVCLVGSFGDLSQFSDTPRFPSTGSWTLILTLPLFLTNSVSTLSMGYKAWKYKVEIKQTLGLLHNKRNTVERVLILLTESGSIYCFLWLSILIFGLASSNNQSLSYQLIIVILPQLVAIYPILIILLLALEKANLESSVTGPSFSQSLQFASRPPVATETQSDFPPDSTTSHLASVRPDPNRDDVSDSGTDIATAALFVRNESYEKTEKHCSVQFVYA
ncbi:hypothetical protein C8J56DRAFT_886918 [Mycena floridula]|nr:hypothetical protein C8J56DRAFT_886918 [Mycena floridula]